jgi:Holliday junction resolvase RusA-like endonuclease
MSRLEIVVYGRPAPGGSKTSGVRKDGRRFVRDSSTRAAPWKGKVEQAAGEAMIAHGLSLLEGALEFVATFYLPRPQSHYGARGLRPSAPRYPTTRPDVTKLLRPVEDALTGVVWRDDSQIVKQLARKRYGAPARVEIDVVEIR